MRAKFKCTEVSKKEGWGVNPILYSAKLSVVYNGSPENESFFAATPGGSIELSTVAKDHFEVGKFYYVDFTEVE